MPHGARLILLFATLIVLPLVWSVATALSAPLAEFGLRFLGPRYLGPYLALDYAKVLLAALSGALLGMVLLQGRVRAGLVALAGGPALWAFLFGGGGPFGAALWLAVGHLLLLGLDLVFWRRGMTPEWWWPMRVGQTAVIVLCLLLTAFG